MNTSRLNDIQQQPVTTPIITSKPTHSIQKPTNHQHRDSHSSQTQQHYSEPNHYEAVDKRYGVASAVIQPPDTHQPTRSTDAKIPKPKPPTEQIYTRAADRNYHYQQVQQQQQHFASPNDGKSP